jgi:hypothetical protein
VILILSENCCLVSVKCALSREAGFVPCQSPSAVFVHCQVLFFIFLFPFYVSRMFYVYTIYTRPLSPQAQYSKSCPIICSLLYNSSLQIWIVIRLTATKFKPLKLSMSRFALPYILDISIYIILYDFRLLPTYFCYIIVNRWNIENLMQFADRYVTVKFIMGDLVVGDRIISKLDA